MNSSRYFSLILFFKIFYFINSEILQPFDEYEIQCAQDVDINWKDLMEYAHDRMQPSEKMLCFLKCKYEKNGNLDHYGFVDMKLIERRIQRIECLTEGDKEELTGCFREIDVIKTCRDMTKILSCISDIKGIHYEMVTTFSKERIKCAQGLNVTWEELFQFQQHRFQNSPTKMFCLIKCAAELQGFISREGKVNHTLIDKIVDESPMNTKRKVDTKNCFKQINTVTKCEDTEALLDCIPDERVEEQKHLKECSEELGLQYYTSRSGTNLKRQDENFFCLQRCLYQKNGSLKDDGEWNWNIATEEIKRLKFLNTLQKQQVITCLKTLPPIKTCEYMKYVMQCFVILEKHEGLSK